MFLKGGADILQLISYILTAVPEYPRAWELEAASDEEAEGDNDSDEEEVEAAETSKIKPSGSKVLVSHAYEEFRQFLELGCMGSAAQGYPAIIIILSTIPSSVRLKSSYITLFIFMDKLRSLRQFLCQYRRSSPPSGQLSTAEHLVAWIAPLRLLHFYLPFWSPPGSLRAEH